MTYTLTEIANRDLENVLEYGLKVWGLDSAKTYFFDIMSEIQHCAESPRIGKVVPVYKPEVRCWLARDYLVFYRVRQNDIEVFRVAHQRSDILKWLRGQTPKPNSPNKAN